MAIRNPASVLIVLLAVFPGWASGTTLTVPGDFATIQECIDAAQTGVDECVVAPGTYNECINFNGKAITLRSSNGRNVTTLNGTGLNCSVVKCVSGEGLGTVLDGFTVTGGTGTLDPDCAGGVFVGGGMYNKDSSPIVTNCTFSANNGAHTGGGMFNCSSSPTVSDCTFTQNAPTDHGGGMYNFDNSNPTVTNCDFTNNVGKADGAGMFNHTNSSPEVRNCTFSGNSVIGGIGGQDGGGMVNANNSNPIVTNCTFSGNTAGLDGGGMLNANSSPRVTNCTFSRNTAGNLGGGIHNEDTTLLTVDSSIFWDNSDSGGTDESAQIHDDAGSKSEVNYSCVQGTWTGNGGNNIDTDPMFVDADGPDNTPGNEDDNLRLTIGSPCIDVGNNSVVAKATDLDGNPRIVNCTVDMGAYEHQMPCTGPDMDGDGVCDACDLCPGFDDALPCPIPTVSEWGMIAMTLLVLAAGTVVLIRRRSLEA